MNSYLRKNYYPHLDGLRGGAIILVLLSHFYNFSPGWIGVGLFFVLSGFLITKILLQSTLDFKSIKAFYIRRILRIFPLYFLVLSLFFGLGKLYFYDGIPEFAFMQKHQLYFWTYLQNFLIIFNHDETYTLNHFWSLAVEEQFYLFWPLIIFCFRKDTNTLLNVFFILIILSTTLKYTFNDSGISYALLPFRMDSLILGGVIAVLLHNNIQLHINIVITLLVIGILVFLTAGIFSGSFLNTVPLMSQIGFFAIDLFFACFLFISLFLTKLGGYVRSIFSLKILKVLGKYSYGIYVIHWPLLQIIKGNTYFKAVSPWLLNTGILLISLLLSYVSYEVFESKFLHLKKYFLMSEKKFKPELTNH